MDEVEFRLRSLFEQAVCYRYTARHSLSEDKSENTDHEQIRNKVISFFDGLEYLTSHDLQDRLWYYLQEADTEDALQSDEYLSVKRMKMKSLCEVLYRFEFNKFCPQNERINSMIDYFISLENEALSEKGRKRKNDHNSYARRKRKK